MSAQEIVEVAHPIEPRPLEEAAPAALEAAGILGLHVGCWDVLHPGWLNTDVARMRDPEGRTTHAGGLFKIGEALFFEHDATRPFPAPDGSFARILSEHMIEHVHPLEAVAFLGEARRLLRPGGTLRVSTPDLGRYCEGYVDPRQRFFEEHREALRGMIADEVPPRRAWMVNQIFYGYGHRYIYDFEELVWALGEAGFPAEQVRRRDFREGEDAALAALDLEVRRDESVYVEARR